jgi:hypothetical protein
MYRYILDTTVREIQQTSRNRTTAGTKQEKLARAGGAQHATEPHPTPNERYSTDTILFEPVKLLSASISNHINKGQTGTQQDRK